MSVLVLRLAAPLQSWGTQSRFSVRDTAREPSKSGVIGLIAAALGRPRDAEVGDLMALRMCVRIDRDGTLQRDYQTAGGGRIPNRSAYGVAESNAPSGKAVTASKMRTVTSDRYYLADADFRVALESNDDSLLETIVNALAQPKWPLYLGRKAFVPSHPVCLGIRPSQTAREVLEQVEPWFARSSREKENFNDDNRRRAVCEVDPAKLPVARLAECDVRQDVIDRFDSRDFQLRHVETHWLTLSPELVSEDPSCFSHH